MTDTETRYRAVLAQMRENMRDHTDSLAYLDALNANPAPLADTLKAQLQSADAKQQSSAAWFIGRLNDETWVAPLLSAYETLSDEDVRGEIVRSVGMLGGAAAEKRLITLLIDHKVVLSLRVAAAYALQNIRTPAVAAALLAILRGTNNDAALRDKAAESLSYVANATTLPSILLFLRDPDARVRYSTLYTVRELGDMTYSAHVEPLLNDAGQAVYDENYRPYVRDLARETLEKWAAQE
jgi:HEAT repeat protein